jgi:transposase
MSRGQRFSDDFKTQIVRLYQSGKKASVLSKEYDISLTTIYKWVKESSKTGSFKTNDNLTDE